MYALWGIEDGIKQIVWVPTCISLLKNHRKGERAKEIIKKGTTLRLSLDKAIRRAYLSGKPPGLLDRVLVKWKARSLRVYCQNSKAEQCLTMRFNRPLTRRLSFIVRRYNVRNFGWENTKK